MPGYELIGVDEKNAVSKIFDEGGILFHRSFEDVRKKFYVREFNSKCEKYFNIKNCSAVSSGTAAIKCALKAAGIGPGDEVITQAFNFVACVEAIIDVGAKPIICSVDKNLHLDITNLEKKITKKTKAVLAVHMLGLGCDMKSLNKFCISNNLILLEDACEAIGGKYNKKHYGTLGDIGIFSFDFAKTITCGEGGLTLTNNEKYGTYIKQFIDHGHENNPNLARGHDNRVMPGFNYRITEMQAAVISVQLDKLEFIVNENFKRYSILKEKIGQYTHVRKEFDNHSGSYDTFIFSVDKKETCNKIINFLNTESIGTKIIPDAMEWHCSAYWGHALEKNEVQDSLSSLDHLEHSIGIPILINLPTETYFELGDSIIKLLKN